MNKRTITELSRELCVSRTRIYRAIAKLDITKKSNGTYSVKDWQLLKNELKPVSKNNKEKLSDSKKIETANKQANCRGAKKNKELSKLTELERSTLKERLNDAKREYAYNKEMIITFQDEIAAYIEKYKKTTATTHNGTQAQISAITSLEKYDKLNITKSRLISELEEKLGYELTGEDNPFE